MTHPIDPPVMDGRIQQRLTVWWVLTMLAQPLLGGVLWGLVASFESVLHGLGAALPVPTTLMLTYPWLGLPLTVLGVAAGCPLLAGTTLSRARASWVRFGLSVALLASLLALGLGTWAMYLPLMDMCAPVC